MVIGAPPPLLNVTVLAALVVAGTADWSPKARLVGVKVAAATGVSAGAVQVPAAGPPTTPAPFSKMVPSVRASGSRPSQTARDSAPTKLVPVVEVPPTARARSLAVVSWYVAVQLVEPGP